MAPPVRRMRPATAAARGVSTRTEVVQGKGFVSATVKDRQGPYYDNEKTFDLREVRFTSDDPPAYVKVGGGLTINMGNFESLRVDCSVSIPCHRNRIEEALQEASDIVAARISEEETNWLGEDSSKRLTGKGK